MADITCVFYTTIVLWRSNKNVEYRIVLRGGLYGVLYAVVERWRVAVSGARPAQRARATLAAARPAALDLARQYALSARQEHLPARLFHVSLADPDNSLPTWLEEFLVTTLSFKVTAPNFTSML